MNRISMNTGGSSRLGARQLRLMTHSGTVFLLVIVWPSLSGFTSVLTLLGSVDCKPFGQTFSPSMTWNNAELQMQDEQQFVGRLVD
jgi:hypothetical protein